MGIIFLCLLGLMALGWVVSQWLQRRPVRRWEKAWRLTHHRQLFSQLYADVNGFSLSYAARRQQDAFEYVYGEIDFTSFIALLSLTHPTNRTIFYDLGSGTGKAVLACAMVFPVLKSCGIELFPTLHQAALQQQQRLAALPDYAARAKRISFYNADLLTADLCEATLIFINATGFFGATWNKLSQYLAASCPQTTVITTSKPLQSSAHVHFRTVHVKMSWGVVRAYLHRPQQSPQQKAGQLVDIIE